MASDYKSIASKIKFEGRAFIDGKYVDAIDGEKFENINPATGEKLCTVSKCNHKDVDLAVKVSRKAFNSGVWSRTSPEFRKDAQDAADKLQRECFMKAADEAGRAALKAAMSGDNDARNESVKKTRDYLGKAMSLKAPKEFKMACDRVLDIAQMTGGIKSDKPTKAKPQMTKAEVESKEAAKHKLDEPKEGAEIPVKGKAEKDLKNLTNA